MAGQEQQQPQSRDTEVDEDIPAAPPAPAGRPGLGRHPGRR